MGYAILHMQKFSSWALQGIQSHMQREKESHTNPDINYQKTVDNYAINGADAAALQKKVNERIKQLNLKKTIRKDAIKCCGLMITGSPEDIAKMSLAEQKEYFHESVEWVKKRYGAENVVYSVVHNDEKTPHLHVGVVPVTSDGRLSAKTLFCRTELRAMQTSFAEEVGKQFGLERGNEGSERGHLSEVRFKLASERDEFTKMNDLLQKREKAVVEALREFDRILADIKNYEFTSAEIDRIKKTAYYQKKLFGENKDIVEMPTSEFIKLLKIARQSDDLQERVQQLTTVLNSNKATKVSYDEHRQLIEQLALEKSRARETVAACNRERKKMQEYVKLVKLAVPDIKKKIAQAIAEKNKNHNQWQGYTR